MWPFSGRKKEADLAVEWMPRAIEIAATKWNEFRAFPSIAESPLEMQIFAFRTMLEKGLREWKAFKNAPDAIFLLIAALGIEYSGAHSRDELESCLGLRLPSNPLIGDSSRSFSDSQITAEVLDDLVARAKNKWVYFNDTLKFKEGVPLAARIEGFLVPFSEHVRNRPGLEHAPDDLIRRVVAIGIADSGSHSLDETVTALGITV
jgi:hypothetical protein